MKHLYECRCGESKGECCCGVCDKCGSLIKYAIFEESTQFKPPCDYCNSQICECDWKEEEKKDD